MWRSAHGMVDKHHDTLEYGDFKFTFSYQVGAVIGIYQLETVICVGMEGYMVNLLVCIDLTKLTNEP
jgi:hypothetical protein